MDGTKQLSATAYCLSNSSVYANCFFNFWQLGQSVDGNYTTIRFEAWIDQRGIQWNGTTRKKGGIVSGWINGTCVFSEYYPLNRGGANTRVWDSGIRDFNVYHNADGSKSCTFELKLDTGVDQEGNTQIYKWGGSDKKSTSETLTSIPRASQPTLSASEKSTGETIGITTNRKSGNFTHLLWWDCGNSTWNVIASGVGDSYSWTIPKSLANAITSVTSATVTIRCRTYSGNTQIGSDKTTSFKVNVSSDIKPSISGFSVWEAVSNVSNKFGLYLKGASKLGISFDDSGSYGSWITYRRITANNQTFENNKSATTDFLSWSGSMSVTVTVSDSRGRTASTSTTITVQDYGTPWVESFKGIRCNSDGSTNDSGSYIKLKFKAGVYSVSSKNTAQYQLGYRVADTGNYVWKILDISSLSYDSTTGAISGLTFSPDKSYDLVLWVGDKLGNEARRPDTLPTEFDMIDWYSDGTGMAIGKVAESPNLFDVGLNSHFRKNLRLDNVLYPNITSPNIQNNGGGNSATYMQIATIKVNLAYANVPFVIEYLQRGSSGATRLHISFTSGDTTDPSLGLFAYEGRCRGAYLAKVSTSTWNLYITKSEAWENIGITNICLYDASAITITKVQNTNISSLPSGGTWAIELSPFRVKDVNQSDNVTFAYSKSGMWLNNVTWLACWNGYELRAINKNQLEDSGYDSSSGWYWYTTFNGMMIMQRYILYNISSFKAWGNMFVYECNYNRDQVPNYPYSFTRTPVRTVSLTDGSNANLSNATPVSEGIDAAPLTNFGGFVLMRPTQLSMNAKLCLTAIGPYK